ncbi:MAG TPA: 5'/3'-nucleotidase SurE [Gemmatimonadota bacterium]|nr:5'/3'-nucleotidase SurE [Gemmatimonadota bacterium]
MLFLVTNDDGYLAPGIRSLARALEPLGDVVVVAPDREQSATSHSLTLHHPLRVRQTAENRYHVDGTPTDCVMLAVNAILDRRPDYVFSGINHGGNMGEDVLYSGTVSAAMEGTILGIPSIAISLVHADETWLAGYETVIRRLVRRIVTEPATRAFSSDTLVNVNLPDRDPATVRGVRVTSLGKRVYVDPVVTDKDPHGKTYYWIGGGEPTWEGPAGSDYHAVQAGYVSITPIQLDLTHHRVLPDLSAWEEIDLAEPE